MNSNSHFRKWPPFSNTQLQL